MMTSIRRALQWLAGSVLVLAFLCGASASAFEAHNLVEPPFGSFGEVGGLAVDQSNGNVYTTDRKSEEVKVFGPEGGMPAGGAPSSFTGAGSFKKSFTSVGGVAVDNACSLRKLSGSECASFDPSNGDVYIPVPGQNVLDKYRLNGSSQYEYVCEFEHYGGGGSRCLADGGGEGRPEGETLPEGTQLEGNGVAVDSAGDVYVGARIGYSHGGILEFNVAGEALHAFGLPAGPEGPPQYLAVSSSGTIYAQVFISTTSAYAVLELKRSSLTGAVEGEPAIIPNTKGVEGLAFDQANGQLFLDLGSSGEALNGAHEVVSRFGSSGVIAHGGALAVDEATGDVYVANHVEQNIDRFGPGVVATLPVVDETPPSASSATRTSALLSGTVATGNATTTYQLEYVSAGEYKPAAANPYAGGGTTLPSKLAPAAVGTGVGPLPLTGLLAGTTYHYRLVATNELGTTYGQDHTFTTAAATPPTVTTGAAGEVTQTTATLSGTVGPRELQTSYVFEVGTDTGYGGAKLFGNAGQSGGTETVSVSLQFLIPGATYHYRLAATNQDGTSYGQDMTFTTPGVSSSIVQPPATLLIATPPLVFPQESGTATKPPANKKKTKSKKKSGNGKHKKKTKFKKKR